MRSMLTDIFQMTGCNSLSELKANFDVIDLNDLIECLDVDNYSYSDRHNVLKSLFTDNYYINT